MKYAVLPIVPCLLLAACEGEPTDGSAPTEEELAIAGSYTDTWGTEHEIDEVTWTQRLGSHPELVFDMSDWSNAERWVVAQNGADNGYFPLAWSRFDWTDTGGRLWFCQSAYDAESSEAAHATPAASDADPETGGCGGFPWTELL